MYDLHYISMLSNPNWKKVLVAKIIFLKNYITFPQASFTALSKWNVQWFALKHIQFETDGRESVSVLLNWLLYFSHHSEIKCPVALEGIALLNLKITYTNQTESVNKSKCLIKTYLQWHLACFYKPFASTS